MKLASNLRLVRIGEKWSGILDSNDKLVAFAKRIISMKEVKPLWDWVRSDFAEVNP